MLKKFKAFFIIILSFIITFVYQQESFANTNTYSLEKKYVFTEYKNENVINNINNKKEDYTWVASILLPGLGQILMGEIFTGVSIFAEFILFSYFSFILIDWSKPQGDNFGIMFTIPLSVLSIVITIAIYIGNIIDAVIMSKEKVDNKYYEEYKSTKQSIKYNNIKLNSKKNLAYFEILAF